MSPTPPQNLTELCTGFLAIGARVMPWAHRTMVEERRWLTPADVNGVMNFGPDNVVLLPLRFVRFEGGKWVPIKSDELIGARSPPISSGATRRSDGCVAES